MPCWQLWVGYRRSREAVTGQERSFSMTTSMAAFRGLMGASVTIGVDMARLPGYGPGSPRGSNSDVGVVDTGQHTQMSNGGEMRLALRIDVQLAHVAAQIGHKCAAPP